MPQAYRSALHANPRAIRDLDPAGLRDLFRRLIMAEAAICNADLSQITVNAEERASDEGCDAFSGGHSGPTVWLKGEPTCWQLKAGSAGEPAELVGEVTKAIPAKTLRDGGWYIVVASDCGRGEAGRRKRVEVLRKEAQTAGLPIEKIDVYTAETLETWCNVRPSASWAMAGRPPGLTTIDEWEHDPRHHMAFVTADATATALAEQRRALAFGGLAGHLHVWGQAGAGKTRHVLELCNGAPWRGLVVYFPNPDDGRLPELIAGVSDSASVRLVVVVDECLLADVRRLHESIATKTDRVRLITIGALGRLEAENVATFKVSPLDAALMRKVLVSWYPSMPIEHQDYLVQLAEGFVKFARLAGEALLKVPSVDIRSILGADQVRALMDRMLEGLDRKYLFVPAIMQSVGWEGVREAEGKAVADCLGLNWSDVRRHVNEANDRFGIAPSGGRLRYISPRPLAIFLAMEAWNVYATELKTLPGKLPSDEARRAHEKRLGDVLGHPAAKNMSEEEIARFLVLADLSDGQAARRWALFSSGAPALAARNLRRIFERASRKELIALSGDSRREIVWQLVRLAQRPQTFEDVAVCLAELAFAESETWANNASAEFKARFQIYLSGTATPYLERLSVIEVILRRPEKGYRQLAVQALGQVGNTFHTGHKSGPTTLEPDEPDWIPADRPELFRCMLAALELLTRASEGAADGVLLEEILSAADNCMSLLDYQDTDNAVAALVRMISIRHPIARERLRLVVARAISRRTAGADVSQTHQTTLVEQLYADLRDTSLEGRLRECLTTTSLVPNTPTPGPALESLALEFVRQPSLVDDHRALLTSGELPAIWDFGRSLAKADAAEALLDRILREAPDRGPDLRLVAAYVIERQTARQDETWADDLMDRYFKEHPSAFQLVFEMTWRGRPTTRAAERLRRLLRACPVNAPLVGMLEYGKWADEIPADEAVQLLDLLVAVPEYRSTALSIVAGRLVARPDDTPAFEKAALALLLDRNLIRENRTMTEYHWVQLAGRMSEAHAADLAGAIVRAQYEDPNWFPRYHGATSTLSTLVTKDPQGFWLHLRPLLEKKGGMRLLYQLPTGTVDDLPREDLLAWTAADKTGRRPGSVAGVAAKTYGDQSLVADLLARFGTDEGVKGSLRSSYVSGSWSGSTAEHYAQLAEALEKVGRESARPELRTWARETAVDLRRDESHEREREDEEHLRRW